MNKALIACLFFFSFSSVFALNTYDVRDYTCSELNQALQEEEIILVKYQLFFGATGTHFADKNACSECFRPSPSSVKSKSGFCRVGWSCVKKSRDQIDRENRRRPRPLRCLGARPY